MGEALEILAEELAKIEHNEEAHNIRARIEAQGMQIPHSSDMCQRSDE
jgi:hypothetical protein